MAENALQSTRVLLIHNFLSPYRVPLFEELAKRVDLDVWILGDIRSVRNWRSDAPNAGFRLRKLPHITIPLNSAYNVILINQTLPAALYRQKADVILCCAWDTPATFYAALHARVAGIPFVLWSGSTPAESTWLRAITRPMVSTLVKSAASWVAYGSRAKAYLESLGAKRDRIFIAYNPVETESFARQALESDGARLRDWLGVTTRYLALYCGNLLELKGVGDLIEAFGKHLRRDDVTLVLVGSGKHEEKFRARVRDLGMENRVIFTGFVTREAMPGYYAIADLQIVPSRSEVWGLVINEALACGVPVVATDACGAAHDLLNDGVNGYIVPAQNPEKLAEAVNEHFEHPERHAAMRNAARDGMASFSMARAADAIADAVRCAIANKQ